MPSLLTRVSDFIPEITDYIDKIHQNGMAYTTNGSVYFDTQAFRQATSSLSTNLLVSCPQMCPQWSTAVDVFSNGLHTIYCTRAGKMTSAAGHGDCDHLSQANPAQTP